MGGTPAPPGGAAYDNVMSWRGFGKHRWPRRSPGGAMPFASTRHAAPTTQPSHEASSMLAIIGGTGLTRLSTLAVAHREVIRTPYGEPSAALVFGELAGAPGDLPRAARPRPHDTAAPRQLPRESVGAEGAGRERRTGRRLGRRHSRLRAGRPRRCRISSSTTRRDARTRSSTAATSRSCTSTSRTRTRAALRAALPGRRPARRHRAASTAASTARCRGPGSRLPPRSTGWIATARRSSA